MCFLVIWLNTDPSASLLPVFITQLPGVMTELVLFHQRTGLLVLINTCTLPHTHTFYYQKLMEVYFQLVKFQYQTTHDSVKILFFFFNPLTKTTVRKSHFLFC